MQVVDGWLYALSRFGGLSVIDATVPDHLELLGRYNSAGRPFEMYVRDAVVYAIFTAWTPYTDELLDGTSRLEALDVTNPGHIRLVGGFQIPGEITDSRLVGDVLYAVSFQSADCPGCAETPRTTVTSLSVADPADVKVVDSLTYADDRFEDLGWRRSVSATTERLYVAAIEWDGSSAGHSTIQVVDISDPGGKLVEGASVEAYGQILSRWQMDEHQGVLRVISQPGVWSEQDVPRVQTFAVHSSFQIEPLAVLEMVLPKPESLRAARFDGERAYAITATGGGQYQASPERWMPPPEPPPVPVDDPLFVFDLSDPAKPKQLGYVRIPGWIHHIEPRGDRLLGLGYDWTDPQGMLSLSLFDVADVEHPKMLARLAFGGSYADFTEDQNRIHKAFTVLGDLDLVLAPYGAWSEGKGPDCLSFDGGVQLFDFTGDSLTRRGLVPTHGPPRRAFVHEGRLFTMADEQLRTFDISDRDAPEQVQSFPLALLAYGAVATPELVAWLSVDWWSGRPLLEVAPAGDPALAVPAGAVDLSALPPFSGDGCKRVPLVDSWPHGGGVRAAVGLLAHGRRVYLVWPGATMYDLRVTVVDATNPANPRLAGTVELEAGVWWRGLPPWMGNLGAPAVQVGSSLVLLQTEVDAAHFGPCALGNAWLDILDLSDPDAPVHAATVVLPPAQGFGLLQVDGQTVVSSRWVPLADDPSKARFYLDRVDVSNPHAPRPLPALNVPGWVIALDSEHDRAITIDYHRVTVEGVEVGDCSQFEGPVDYHPCLPGEPHGPGCCTGLERSFKLVEGLEDCPAVRGVSPIAHGAILSDLHLGQDRVFLRAEDYALQDDPTANEWGERIEVLGGLATGELVRVSARPPYGAQSWPVGASGTKLVFAPWFDDGPPVLTVVDAADMGKPLLEQKVPLLTHPEGVALAGDTAICSLAGWGLAAVDLGQ
ncbi:MAG: beta-propeller domain-containing protein [Deltaproteobacteria bacterium]|nr:beta-propeller domain-containing protein [Deltaproteobacteria bacterium]